MLPHLKEILPTPNKQDLVKIISRLEADHKLIDAIGEQIRLRTAQSSDPETLRKRILLYATTVESHNSSEESLIFHENRGRKPPNFMSGRNAPIEDV